MASRLDRKTVAVYTAAVAGVAARPAYCESERVLVGYARRQGERFQLIPVPANPVALQNSYNWVYFSSGGVLVPRYENVVTCYPAVQARAAVPAQLDYHANSGWNSGARSIERLPEDGLFRGSMPDQPVAVMVGIVGRSFDNAYARMSHAIIVRPTGFSIVEYGLTVQPEQPIPAGARVEIRRRNRVVTFRINDDLVYTSALPSAGEAYIGAMLYSLSDSISDAELVAIGGAVASVDSQLPALRGVVSDRQLSLVDAALPQLVMSATLGRPRGRVRFDARLPALLGLASDRNLVLADLELPALQIDAILGRKEYVPSQVVCVLPMIALSAHLRSGRKGNVDAALPALAGVIGDRPQSFVQGTLPLALSMFAAAAYMPPGEADGMDGLIAGDMASLEAAFILLAIDSLDVSSVADLVIVLELRGIDTMSIAETGSMAEIVELIAIEQVAISSGAYSSHREALQYAVNAATGALTRYEGFDFHGFVRLDGETYGWKPDGLYRLGSETDNGTPIARALIDFGTSDYASSQAKRATDAYLGARTDGQCFVRVKVDHGADQIYRVVGNETVLRARLAKGASGRYWSVSLELTDVSFAQVDSLEVAIAVTQRRAFKAGR